MAEFDPTDPHAGQEAWQYTGKGKVYLRKYTGRHGEVAYETVRGGQTFHLTPAERLLNSDMVRDPKRDPFKNGELVAVRLVDGDGGTSPADRKAIEENPANLTDEQITALFSSKKTGPQLADVLEQIENPVVIDRILQLAQAADLPMSKIRAIESRAADVDPTGSGESILIRAENERDRPEIYQDMGAGAIRVGGATE